MCELRCLRSLTLISVPCGRKILYGDRHTVSSSTEATDMEILTNHRPGEMEDE